MTAGQLVTLRCGRLFGKRAEVLSVSGRFVTVRGSFGTATVLASEVSA